MNSIVLVFEFTILFKIIMGDLKFINQTNQAYILFHNWDYFLHLPFGSPFIKQLSLFYSCQGEYYLEALGHPNESLTEFIKRWYRLHYFIETVFTE